MDRTCRLADEGSLPSADTIASDFQRFLRQRGPDDSAESS